MILLRWVAIIGQLTAVTVAQIIYGLQLEFSLCYLAIGASVVGNLLAVFIFPENKRLSEVENLSMVLFDLLQLSFLLFLTGGLHNPFALLLLGPVTISATALSLRSTLVLCGTAIAAASLLALVHFPLVTQSGSVLKLPQIFVFGHWTALVIAILFTSAYSRRVTSEIHSMADALAATQMVLAREQKLTDLGGVVAAAAHELGTPLATIKLASSELFNDLQDRPELAEDAALIRDQADRCRDILRDMGRSGKDDLHMQRAPLTAVIKEAAEPHIGRGKSVYFSDNPMGGMQIRQPIIPRKPEIIHGLRNLVQNAVDFAAAHVWIETEWGPDGISVRIIDDGPGFPPQDLGRIGDPFMRRRSDAPHAPERPEYEGMGLGLFIAKTFLERAGARLRFANGIDGGWLRGLPPAGSGAVVEVSWPRNVLELPQPEGGQGENRHITA
tara:strand:- start:26463 stop:27788 length:1326 start_codon:yes stop_codon:yes gene_type:complete